MSDGGTRTGRGGGAADIVPPDPALAPPDRPTGPSYRQIAGVVLGSALLPGSGHLAAGHRRSGRAILALFSAALLTLGVLALLAARSPGAAASYAVRPAWLTAVRVGVVAAAAAWVAVVVRAAALVRPGRRGAAGRVLATALTVVVTLGIAAPALTLSRYAGLQRNLVEDVFPDRPTAAGPDRPAVPREEAFSDGRVNVLLVGADSGPDRRGLRSDTMILASVDTETGASVLFTLPRNMERVPFPPGSVMAKRWPNGFNCGDNCLLNAVYEWAVENRPLFPGDPDPGMTALRGAVSATLGLPVEYHVIVNLEGFRRLVDALGGVTLRVERRLPIGGLDAEGRHVRPAGYIEPGLQHMDGATALNYARSRSDSTDYERGGRQRCVLGAIARQAEPRRVIANFQAVAESTKDAVDTDIPQDVLPDLVKVAFKAKDQPITSLAFVPPLVPDTARPDFAKIRSLAAAALLPAPSGAPAPGPPTATAGPGGPTPSASPGVPTGPAGEVPLDAVCQYS